MKIHDLVLGAFLLLLAVFLFVYARTLPPMPGQRYGADVFPILVAVGLGLFSVLLMVRGWRARAPDDRWVAVTQWARDPYTRGNFILASLAIVVYVALDDYIGFVPLGIAILMTLFIRQSVPWKRSAVIAVVATVAIQYLFGSLLRVPLPRGLLTDYMW
jgi:putative tricarboxylic transport membrane protein